MTPGSRQDRQRERRRAITQAVIDDGTLRIESIAERFGISVMTVHRDLDELEAQGLLRKTRGGATVHSSALVESSDLYRSGRQPAEKEAIALAALELVEPGQAVMLDDSTTTLHLVEHLGSRVPLTAITNTLTVMNALRELPGVTLLTLGGRYYAWCSAFMGRMTVDAIRGLRADLLIMSTSAITDDIAFHQTQETVDVKRAMFESASRRILLADHTKFGRRALHAMLPLAEFDVVVVDDRTDRTHIDRLRESGVQVVVAPVGDAPDRGVSA